MAAKINWEIMKKVILLDVNPVGWKKELNMVSWYGKEPVFDVRWWHPEQEKCGKGITLTKEEIGLMYQALQQLEETGIEVF